MKHETSAASSSSGHQALTEHFYTGCTQIPYWHVTVNKLHVTWPTAATERRTTGSVSKHVHHLMDY